MNWEPAHADHAIDSVTLVISLAEAIDPNTFERLLWRDRKAGHPYEFTHRVDGLEPLQVQPGNQLILDSSAMLHRRRVAFQRRAGDATIGEFAIGSTAIAIASSRYTSWTAFRTMAVGLINALNEASAILGEVLSSEQLQYTRVFTSTVVLADPFEILSKESHFLASVLNDKARAFHCHSGWFDYPEGTNRALTNVNITVVDNSPPLAFDTKSKITILTMVRVEALNGSSPRTA